MGTRSIFAVMLVLLGFPAWTTAQQGAPATSQKTQAKSKVSNAPPVEKENWQDLADLKTGLKPTSLAEVNHVEKAGFVRQLIRVEWRVGDPIDLWIVRPKVAGKVPVILYLYSYQDSGDRFRDDGWGERATAGGFAAVGFVSNLTDYRFRLRPLKEWFVSDLGESLGTTAHDVQLALNYLASRGDMDMDQVGMFGMGSGASIAILAAHADPRIKTLDLLDPWGDWPDWLKGTQLLKDDNRTDYLKPEFLKSVAALDPVSFLPSLKTRSIRLQQTSSEPQTPDVAKERIAAAMPVSGQVVKYADPNDLYKAWQTGGLSGWIKQQMRPQTAGNDATHSQEAQAHDKENGN